MRLCESEKCHCCILHHNKAKGRSMLFVFRNDPQAPDYVIKIYEKNAAIDPMEKVLRTIRSSDDAFFAESVPRLLQEKVSRGYRMEHEEYVRIPFMQGDAEGRSWGWEKKFRLNLALMARWLVCFNNAFASGKRKISSEKIKIASEAVARFCRCCDLDIPDVDVDLPQVAVHGNLSPNNIARQDKRLVVLDWDYLKPRGLPLFDLLDFIMRYLHFHYKLQKDGVFLTRESLLGYFCLFYSCEEPPLSWVGSHIDDYCRRVGVGEVEKKVLLLLWLYGQDTHNEDIASWVFS